MPSYGRPDVYSVITKCAVNVIKLTYISYAVDRYATR